MFFKFDLIHTNLEILNYPVSPSAQSSFQSVTMIPLLRDALNEACAGDERVK